MFGELIFLVAFSLCCFLRLSLDKPKFVVAGRRPEVESARSSGGGQGGGRASPLPRRRREILRISVGIQDLCEFRPSALEGEIRERKEAAPRATRPANDTITHFAEFWPGLYYRTSVNMGSVKFQTPGDTVLARP
jgi:hypothetical protein